MALSDHYAEANSGLVKRGCKTCDWYLSLPPGDQDFFDEKVREALTSRGNMQRLRRAVIAAGHEVARSTFHGHLHEHHLEMATARREGTA